MKGRKLWSFAHNHRKNSPLRPRFFAFCEKSTGAVRFQIEASPDGSLPMEKAASLLAIHCLARGHAPGDYQVLYGMSQEWIANVTLRAKQLLDAAVEQASPVHLSRREQEVLRGVLQHLANKEIAAQLNLSERTVKFHVSSLLAKFGVDSRLGLLRQAGVFLPAELPVPTAAALPLETRLDARSELRREEPVPSRFGVHSRPSRAPVAQAVAQSESRVVRLPRRQLSA